MGYLSGAYRQTETTSHSMCEIADGHQSLRWGGGGSAGRYGEIVLMFPRNRLHSACGGLNLGSKLICTRTVGLWRYDVFSKVFREAILKKKIIFVVNPSRSKISIFVYKSEDTVIMFSAIL